MFELVEYKKTRYTPSLSRGDYPDKIYLISDIDYLMVSIRANTYCIGYQQVLPLGKNYETIFIPHERNKIQGDLPTI